MSGARLVPPRHHPDEPTLLAHVAGGLGEAHRLLIATHLAGCARCRGDVAALELVAGEALFGLEPTDAGSSSRARVLARLDEPAPAAAPATATAPRVAGVVLPPTLRGLRPGRVRWLGPGIRHARLLRTAYGTLHLLRVRPGVSLPQHAHRGLELTCVLEGTFGDGDERYAPGDVSEAAEDADHAPVALGSTDCVCIISTEGRLRFHGWLGLLARPFLPF